ncbi:fibronectin type III-like domain-contianing protein, partial [uncultured Muribaculum sp.]
LGTMIGPSMADVISGKTNPSGKLPFSFPKRLEDNGAHSFGAESYPGIEREGKSPQQQYLEDILVGYRWHDTKKIPAMFPFGHGLSYTTFEYDKASLSSNLMEGDKSITVTVPVTNIGKVAGKEVVQLYIADEKSSLPRPLKELKGFKKVELNPSQTKVVKFEITPDDLKFFDDKAHEWIAEPGKFKVYIGSSSTDIKSTLQFSYK